MVTHYQRREAGYDKNLPVNVNGHDEFAAYWAQEMVRDLQGFGPQVKRDPFPVKGWTGRPALVPAFNVEVSVPGALHPEQVVVIGCHYDGEAVSTQSANDDGSGCAIELGVAKALGMYWRSHHLYPARTLRFVIFDAEEQGIFGSFHYLNSTVNGDVQNIVAMFNEEQNGIAYPLRYLGKLSNPLLPFYIDMSPLQNNGLYPHQNQLSAQQKANITHFRALMQQAVPAVFQQFQAMGFSTLDYHSNGGQNVSQPVFDSDQQNNIRLEDDTLGGSDEIAFTQAGLPAATFLGNFSYYDKNPPPWSYPYDQRQDTIQLMNTFANGSSQKA
ncbi:MAG TPA: M28 family peptidase, partial [Ktedonobacteraceae bacterium]|nr:M28 family peptidase [Ktedonobacteraceae bacterium]